MNTGLLQAGLPIMIWLLMLGIGMCLEPRDFRNIRRHPRAALVAFCVQFLGLPAIAFLLVALVDVPPVIGIGMVLLAASPSGSTSTLLTHLAGGDTALSVVLTACNRILALLTLPLYMGLATAWLAGEAQTPVLPAGEAMGMLAAGVLLPVGIGMLVRHQWPVAAGHLRAPVKGAALVLLLFLVVQVVLQEWVALPAMFRSAGIAMGVLCVAGMALAVLLSDLLRLPAAQRIAVALETGVQSGGTAILVAIGILGSSAMAVPAIIYSLLMYPLAGLVAWQYRHKKMPGWSMSR